jgi:hypothetical protein
VVKAALIMFWTRLPSLNALAQLPSPRFWKQWLREPLASTDTLGRVPTGLYPDRLLQTIFLVYQQRKRNKALPDHQAQAWPCWTATKARPVTGVTAPAAGSAPPIPNTVIAGSTVTIKSPRCYYLGPQNVLRISPATSSTPKSIRTLGYRSSPPLGCGIVALIKGHLPHAARIC